MDTDIRHISQEKPPKRVFLAALIVIFFSGLSASDSIGLVPCSLDGTCLPAEALAEAGVAHSDSVALSSLPLLGESATSSAKAIATALPVRIKIDSVNVDLPIQNPSTTNVDALDALLQQGPARYVESAKLGEDGNVIIFAHSSHLPIVHNQMFRAFNALPDLKQGDSITLVGDDGKNYLYSVDSIAKADVENGTSISLSPSQGKKLTLVTCDTLTGKSARFVLTATFVGTI
jgi:LPXTG-site transpeptidase (sortase) family protein